MKSNEHTDLRQFEMVDLVKDSMIEHYQKYIEYLKRHDWTRESITICEYLATIAKPSTLKAGDDGVVLDIRCPAGLIISIPGTEGLINEYDIEKIRPLEMKLANSNDEEIDSDTNIQIFKHRILRRDIQIGQVLYKDISMLDYSDSPNLFKDYRQLYRFEKGIEIKGEDSIKIYVINPNIDIDIVKFNLGADLWTRHSDSFFTMS